MAGLLGIGQSALRVAYAQLQTTGHNIANANTPGYSRQEGVLATGGALYSGAGYIGTGVDLVTVQRSYDRFLSAELSAQTAAAAAAGARADQLGRLDRVFADTDNGLGVAIDDLNSALADLVNRPFDPSARQAVLARADTLAQRMRGTAGELNHLAVDTDQRIAQSTVEVNQLLDRIAQLNEGIARGAVSGHAPNDLLDQRDQAVARLNGYLKATAYTQADGTISLFAAGGEGLVVGNRAARLVAEADPADPQRQRVMMVLGATQLPVNAATLGGGSLAGLFQFRDVDLKAVGDRLDQFAKGIADAFNAQQAAGVDATGGRGQAMFSVGAPGTGAFAAEFRMVLASGSRLATGYPLAPELASGNAGDVSVAGFEMASNAPQPATAATIRFDESGDYEIVAVSDGGAPEAVLASGSYQPGQPISHDGWTITLTGTPAMGDEIGIVAVTDPATDNRNARAMLGLADKPLIDGATFNDAFAALLVDTGTRIQSAQASHAVSQRLLQDAQAAQAGYAGVDLDEEAARLMQYQQMYQAAARVIQAAGSMFDALLSATSR